MGFYNDDRNVRGNGSRQSTLSYTVGPYGGANFQSYGQAEQYFAQNSGNMTPYGFAGQDAEGMTNLAGINSITNDTQRNAALELHNEKFPSNYPVWPGRNQPRLRFGRTQQPYALDDAPEDAPI